MPAPAPPTPDFDDLLAAAARIAPHAHATPVLRSCGIDALAGCRIAFKAEHLQRGGAFKFRGACNAVLALAETDAARGVVTHSSGNHGAALARAARGRGLGCHVVVPDGAVAAKIDAMSGYGAVVHRCAAGIAAREAACARVMAAQGATLVHPYADPLVIAGQGTAALELLREAGPFDALVVPVGGGGLAAGTAIAMRAWAPDCRLYLAEPSGAAAYDARPSPVFTERIRHGLDLYRGGHAPRLIFTGGYGFGARFSESQVARRYALREGVPADAILIETLSRTTHENLVQARALMLEHDLRRVIVVSDPRHMARALRLSRGLGIDALGSPTPSTRFRTPRTQWNFLAREVYFFHRDLVIPPR